MRFLFVETIQAPIEPVFAFLRDIDRVAGQSGTVVPVYEKVSPGPAGVGTRYREVVRLLPGLHREMMSEIVRFSPPRRLGYCFHGLGLTGKLLYVLEPVEGGTRLVQMQELVPRWPWKLLSPLIGVAFNLMAGRRLPAIKRHLESIRYDPREPLPPPL
jgi:hypothetical protein